METERKFRISGLPPSVILGTGVQIAQGYLVSHPGKLRIRCKGRSLYIAVKGDGAISREESEIQLPAQILECSRH